MIVQDSNIIFAVVGCAFLWYIHQRISGQYAEKQKEKRLQQAFADSQPTEWEYVAEGALNLTLRYKGQDPCLKGHVLRLRKHHHKDLRRHQHSDPWSTSIYFIENIMVPLLGRRYIHPSYRVPVSEHFLNLVSSRISNQRPKHRLHTALDLSVDHGLLMRDNTHVTTDASSPNICIELKVKCGYIPSSPFIRHEVKRRVSRFQMHQRSKFEQGSITSLSRYDPLDLFSGERSRISHALRMLIETPQNNFRVFVDGKMRYPDANGRGNMEQLSGVLKAAIPGGADELIRLLCAVLIREPLLQRIKAAQELDELDIEGLMPVYKSILSRGEKIQYPPLSSNIRPRPPMYEIPSDASAQHDLIHRFLVSCTAKDCSVMIALQPTEKIKNSLSSHDTKRDSKLLQLNEPQTMVNDSGCYYYSVAAVDLDTKPAAKIPYYYKKDKKIVQLYEKLEKKQETTKQHSEYEIATKSADFISSYFESANGISGV